MVELIKKKMRNYTSILKKKTNTMLTRNRAVILLGYESRKRQRQSGICNLKSNVIDGVGKNAPCHVGNCGQDSCLQLGI